MFRHGGYMETVAYKVLTAPQMAELESQGRFAGALIDLQDGYIHLSTAAQLAETIARHFAGQSDLHIASVDLEALGDAIKWEESRGGQLFPHIYGELTLEDVIAYGPLAHEPDGSILLPVAG